MNMWNIEEDKTKEGKTKVCRYMHVGLYVGMYVCMCPARKIAGRAFGCDLEANPAVELESHKLPRNRAALRVRVLKFMYVCLSVCLSVCMHVCMYVCMHVL